MKKAFEVYENFETDKGSVTEDIPLSEYLNKLNLSEDAYRVSGGLLGETYGNCNLE